MIRRGNFYSGGVWQILALCAGLLIGAAGAHAADEPPVAWSVRPDPAVPATLPAGVPATAPASDAIKPDLALTYSLPGSRKLLVPTRPSRFVLTYGDSSNGGWELWDLHVGAKVRSGADAYDLVEPALSPDGQYLAGVQRSQGVEGCATEVWSLATGQRVMRIVSTDENETKVLGFAGADRVVLHHDLARPNYVGVYDIATGQRKARFDVAYSSAQRVFLSPGGAYVIVSGKTQVDFYDTATGRHSGALVLPAPPPGEYILMSSNGAAVAFSPDGREMALMFSKLNGTTRMLLYDVATGRSTGEATLAIHGWPRAEEIEYMPDNSGWLVIRETVVARQTMTPVHSFATIGQLEYVRMATPEQLFQINFDNDHLIFQTANMPKAQMSKAVSVLRAGGKVEDTELPPLGQADAKSAAAMTWEGLKAPAWVKPPLTPAATTRAAAGSVLVRPAPADPRLAWNEDLPTAMMFTSAQSNSVVVEHVGTAVNARTPAGRSATWVEKYDLASGTAQAQVQVSGLMELQDASATGNTLVFRTGAELDRLDVMTLDQKTYKPLAGFRPHPAGSPDVQVAGVWKPSSRIDAAVLADDRHVLTLSSGGMLMCWEVPACKALWQAKLGSRNDGERKLALSSDRKLAAVASVDGIVLFDPLSGTALDILPLAANTAVNSMAFTPDAQRLALLSFTNGTHHLQIFELSSGASAADVPMPAGSGGELLFPSPGYVLVGPDLVNLEKKVVVRRYEATHAIHVGRSSTIRSGSVVPYDEAWFLVGRAGRMPTTLVHMPLPEARAGDALLNLNASDLYVWSPGMKVSLNLTVIGDDKYRQSQLGLWKEGLKDMGFEVVDGGPNVLTVNNFLVDSPPITYTVSGKNEKYTITPHTVSYSIQLSVGGKEVWKDAPQVRAATNSGPMFERLRVDFGESAQHAADRAHPAPTEGSQVKFPPAYLFNERAIDTTRVTRKGLE